MLISALPLLLCCTVNTVDIVITGNGEFIFERNDRVRVKIGIPLLTQPGTTLQLDTGFIGDLSSEQIIDNTAEMEDIEDKDVIHCVKNDTSNSSQ